MEYPYGLSKINEVMYTSFFFSCFCILPSLKVKSSPISSTPPHTLQQLFVTVLSSRAPSLPPPPGSHSISLTALVVSYFKLYTQDLVLTLTNKRDHPVFVFLCLNYPHLIWYISVIFIWLQILCFGLSLHLYKILLSACTTFSLYIHYWGKFRSFPYHTYWELNFNKHGWLCICDIWCQVLLEYPKAWYRCIV